MNYTLVVCMNEENTTKFYKDFVNFKKMMFGFGLDLQSSCFVSDLLGFDYNVFGQGTKIFLEDNEHKASALLVNLKKLQKYDENIYFNPSENIILIRYFEANIKSVKQMISTKLNLVDNSTTLKIFGVSKANLTKYFRSLKRKANMFDFMIFEENLDNNVQIYFNKNAPQQFRNDLLAKIKLELDDFFYADRDITLANAVFEILQVRKLKISTAESFTCGLVANTLISENPGASANIEEAFVVYSDNVKHKTLGVSEKTLREMTAVSEEVAFQMASGLLEKTGVNIAIATTGYANHQNKELNGLFFTAVGDEQAINVYKHKFNGSRKDTIQYGVNVALFETLKKLRKNVLQNANCVV